ncbi:MAG TPA: GGDEF domain-containing protein [Syntrophales bacterium]|nr:GGDEF domain-containing protein [Syntrophales bacterium]HPQ44084.1 GGDEF domain-containing protein [Syntrophales bacterium]
MKDKKRHSSKNLPAEYVTTLYKQHVRGALVRSCASIVMWIFALSAYCTHLIKLHHFTGVSLSVLYLILINPPVLVLLKRITSLRSYQFISIIINFLEITGYTAVIYFLGGIEAAFLTPIYAALITYVGVISTRRYTFFIAFLCSATFSFIVLGDYFGLLPHQSIYQSFNPPWSVRFSNLSVVIGLLFLIAYISSLTSGILKKHRVRLRKKNTELMDTTRDLTDAIDRLRNEIKERKRVEEALKESEKRYRELSTVDALTQLYNSRHFYLQLQAELDRAKRYGHPLTLLMLDLDDFKKFNDTYGHIEGDQVLWRLGQVIKRCLRETDFAYRYGGEEFTILLPMTTSVNGSVTAERIRTEFKKEIFSPVQGQDIHMTVSIGLTQYRPQEDMKTFVHRADQFMYEGKKAGKDRICCEQS